MDENRILDKLDRIEAQNGITLVALARLQEQVSSMPDHENRLRSLERWKYGLPATAITALVAMAASAWTATKGG